MGQGYIKYAIDIIGRIIGNARLAIALHYAMTTEKVEYYIVHSTYDCVFPLYIKMLMEVIVFMAFWMNAICVCNEYNARVKYVYKQ